MLCATAPRIETKVKAISSRTSEISDDFEYERNSTEQVTWTAIVSNAIALGDNWLDLIRIIRESGDIGKRELGANLLAKAEACVPLFDALCDVLRTKSFDVAKVKITNLNIAAHEMKNIRKWLRTWPSISVEELKTIRAEIKDSEYCSDDELNEFLCQI